ncbi:unannotated protein [freshwater metagenome]|uniref:Unannotated protein n=1 Tax=freshwater metagenome TaxID=449393 RepID=A0A6J7FQJ3_9ZZZZ|nr:hypothetical protein [Actinomycetota bacterium]
MATVHTRASSLRAATGRWRVERARAGEPTRMGRVAGRVWTLDLVHVETDRRATACHVARRTDTFRVGEELTGNLALLRDGLHFDRAAPYVGATR